MKLNKRMFSYFFSFQLVMSAFSGPAQAHSGAGAIILLPFVIANEAVDYVYLSAKVFGKGFSVNTLNVAQDSANGIQLTHKKSKLVYNFYKVGLDSELNNLCENRGRLPTPDEILKLHAVRGIDRINAFISKPDEKNYVFGFAEGEKNYFKMHVKKKIVEYYELEPSNEIAPLVCVEDRDEKEAKEREERKWDDYAKNSKYCLENSGNNVEKLARAIRCEDYEKTESLLANNPGLVNSVFEKKSLLEIAATENIYLDDDIFRERNIKIKRDMTKVQQVLVKFGANLNYKVPNQTYEGMEMIPVVFKLRAETMKEVNFDLLNPETISFALNDKFNRSPWYSIEFLTSILNRSNVPEMNKNKQKYADKFLSLNVDSVILKETAPGVADGLATIKYLVNVQHADFKARVASQEKNYPIFVHAIRNFPLTRIQYGSEAKYKEAGVAKVQLFDFMMNVIDLKGANIFDDAAANYKLEAWEVKAVREVQKYVEDNL